MMKTQTKGTFLAMAEVKKCLYVYVNVSEPVSPSYHHMCHLIKTIKGHSEGISDCSEPCLVAWAIFSSFGGAVCTNVEGNFPLCKMIHTIFLHICFAMT